MSGSLKDFSGIDRATSKKSDWITDDKVGVRMRGKRIKAVNQMSRAVRVLNTGNYSLIPGFNGGSDPEADYPYHGNKPDGTADCIGVAMWLQGIDRWQPSISYYGGWINTNSIYGMSELFENLGQDFSRVTLGDLLIYPSYKDLLGRKRYGHAMTVVGFLRPEPTKLKHLKVIHCSQRAYPATRVTPGFYKGSSKSWAFFRLIGDGV